MFCNKLVTIILITAGLFIVTPGCAAERKVGAPGNKETQKKDLKKQAKQKREKKLIAVLESPGSTLFQKAKACQQLSVAGTKRAVPALAALLGDEKLANYARFGLESIPSPSVDEALRGALGKLEGNLLVGVINSIGFRRDARAVKGLSEYLRNHGSKVAEAATAALGRISSPGAVKLLQGTFQDDKVKIAAEHALLDCAQKFAAKKEFGEADRIYGNLIKSKAPVQVRGAAMFGLLTMDDGNSKIPFILKSLESFSDDPVMLREVEKVLCSAAFRIRKSVRRADRVLTLLASTSQAASRCMLLRVLGRIAGKKAFDTLMTASKDPDPAIAGTAMRALSKWPTLRAEPFLFDTVKKTKDEKIRILALKGCVRLFGMGKDSDPGKTVQQYQDLLSYLSTPDEKRIFLSGIETVQHPKALAMVQKFFDDREVSEEAASAAVKIAAIVMGGDPVKTKEVMEEVLLITKDSRTRNQVNVVLKLLAKLEGCITSWRVAGPYMQKGKSYKQLFDIPFGPEKIGMTEKAGKAGTAEKAGVNGKIGMAEKAGNIKWRRLYAGTDLKRPWIVDLLSAIGGDQRVAYALTWIHSDSEQSARLELGSDDGIKAWLNGVLVLKNNVARAAIPYTDKANVILQKGWNRLLCKITQNNSPWEFCARIIRRDGNKLKNIVLDCMHTP